MSMRNKNAKSEIKKEQLLSEQAFISYCNRDEASSHTTKLDIDQKFLKAAEKDGFIKPLLKSKELVRQKDGNERLKMVKYYSPFQIYIVAELAKNSVLNDGLLWEEHAQENLDYYKEHNFRAVSWGRGLEINVEAHKKKKTPKEFNPFVICDYFHRFLAFLHTLELKPKHLREIEERRFFSRLPSLSYNFGLLKDEGLKLLKNYRLDIKALNLLRKEVAQLATTIDPLEHWYYYIKRHTQFRKDLLKGDAALAQELYRIYDLLTIIVETITGEKSKPLFDFLYPDITPLLIQKVDYQHGEDVKALQFAIQQFKEWSKKKRNKPFISNEAMKKLDAVEKKIKYYEQRYDDRSYAGSVRMVEAEEKIKLGDLDRETKKYVTSILRQMKEHKANTKEDKEKEAWEEKVKMEIAMAIMYRLDDLRRELQDILWDVSEKLEDKENEWWQKERDFHNVFWIANREKLAKLPREEQLKLSRKEYDKIVKRAKQWDMRGKEFANSVSRYADLVFCRVCRKNPIRLHIENDNLNMWNTTRLTLCDECVEKGRKKNELVKIKQAKWYCDICGELLYKFVHDNTLSELLFNQAGSALIATLEYGKLKIETQCPNKKCRHRNIRWIESGWLP